MSHIPRATADLHVGLAELDRELEDLASAEEHLETARVLGQRVSITENKHRWHLTMADVRAAAGDHDEAARLMDRAEALYRHGFYPDIRPIPARRARLQIAIGDLDSAADWARDRGLSVEDDPRYLREYEHLTLARLLLAERRAGRRTDDAHGASGVDPVLALLDRLHAAANDVGRSGSLAEIQVLRALAHDANGDLPQALAALEQVQLDAPEPESYVRLFLDEGAPMRELLHRAVADHKVSLPGRLERHLSSAAARDRRSARQQSLVDPLSHRELEVLRLLDSDRTGPEIAGQLFISLNTVRTHTKRIFTKLDVNTRAAAVRRARQLGLL